MAEERIAEFTFEDPPARSYRKYDWGEVAERCKAQPGQWLKVFDNDLHSLTVSVRQGGVKALRSDDGFVFRTAKNHWRDGPRKCTFYVKFDPPKKSTKKGRQ